MIRAGICDQNRHPAEIFVPKIKSRTQNVKPKCGLVPKSNKRKSPGKGGTEEITTNAFTTTYKVITYMYGTDNTEIYKEREGQVIDRLELN